MTVLLQEDETATADRPLLYAVRESNITEQLFLPEVALVMVLTWACKKLCPYIA